MIDGYFAPEADFLGECEGGGKGCGGYTFSPNGRYRLVVLDGFVDGRYEVRGSVVVLNPNGNRRELHSEDEFRTLQASSGSPSTFTFYPLVPRLP